MNYTLDKEYYSTFELAKILRVHNATIRRHIQAGHLKAYKLNPSDKGHYRIYREQVAEYLRNMGAEVEIIEG